MSASPRWPKNIGDAAIALAPLVGLAFAAHEVFIWKGEVRYGVLGFIALLMGFPVPAYLDRRNREENGKDPGKDE